MSSRKGFYLSFLCSLFLISISSYLFIIWHGTDLWSIAVVLFMLALLAGVNAVGTLRQGTCPECGHRFPQHTKISGFKKYRLWSRNKTLITRLICLNCGCELRRIEKNTPRW